VLLHVWVTTFHRKIPILFFIYLFYKNCVFLPQNVFLQIFLQTRLEPVGRSRKFFYLGLFSLTHIQTVTDTHENTCYSLQCKKWNDYLICWARWQKR
jgi:hypothetical protein